MTSEAGQLDAAIRKWLADHPFSQDQELDIHGIPTELFDQLNVDIRLKQLNRQIKGLPLQQQKLLLYLSRDIDPALIIESMEYSSPELFWLDKALLIKEVDPTARQQDVIEVFSINDSLLNEIIAVSDVVDREKEKSKGRRYRNGSLIAAPVILLLLYLFVYPLVVKPDPVALFEKFNSGYTPDRALIDTTTYNGGSYYEALLLMDEKQYMESATLFKELITVDSSLRTSSRWFLALINLRNGDRESCREQLSAIRSEDPDFYKQVAEPLYRKL